MHDERLEHLECPGDYGVIPHSWELSPGRRACILSLVTSAPRDVEVYRQQVLADLPSPISPSRSIAAATGTRWR